jgi:hypothetical protein
MFRRPGRDLIPFFGLSTGGFSMKRLATTPLLAVLAVGAMASAVAAGPQVPSTDARFAIHLTLPTTKLTTVCTTYSPTDPAHPGGQVSCNDYVTAGSLLTAYYAYLVAAKVDTNGISGISFGIEYNGDTGNGVDVNGWFQCADGLPFTSPGPRGEFPAAGGGIRLTWLDCQNTPTLSDGIDAVAGALDVYAYSADRIKITPNRPLDSGPELLIATCAGGESAVDSTFNVGWASFGPGFHGCNPCQGPCVPVNTSTWGKIKNLYGH